jgi:hypothetical protein
MKKITTHFLFVLLILLSLSACAPKADFDVRGTWDYTMTDESGNQYDIGKITFDGSDTKGTYTQINIYEVEYVGDYTVSGAELKLTGYENWQATLDSATMMSGTWQHDDGALGTFEATKR